jgi:hypothetical protein
MVKFRFSIILLCVLLPPLFYVVTVQLVEQYAARRVLSGLESAYLGDMQPLLDGRLRIQTAIDRNVDRFLIQSRWIAWGAKATVTIRTDGNTLLYPVNEIPADDSDRFDLQPLQIGSENFRLLNDNPTVVLDFRLPHNSPLTNAFLAVYISLSVGLLLFYYRHWRIQYQRALESQADMQLRLTRQGHQYLEQLKTMEEDRARLSREVQVAEKRLLETRRQAETNEEEILEELVALEQDMAAKVALQNKYQESVAELQQKIETLESQLQKEQSRKLKSSQMLHKRLAALYKQVEMSDRAINGYLDLTEDLKIRCEEVVHQLDADPGKLVIKRKVFGKKNRETVFEVVFGYKGRLYFLSKEGKKNEVLAIGTKNSQQQDLEYLNRL